MRYIKKYNEGIISKAIELINYSKEADTIVKKYIKMIYDDYKTQKDIFRISIIENNGYTTLKYLITTGDNTDVQISNRDENSINIELTYISNTFGWSNDSTRARLEVTKFKSYKGTLLVCGKDMNNDKIIDDINGQKNDYYSYINVPSGEVKKIIDFFIKVFKSKYPTMSKYYGKREVLELDPYLKILDMENQKRKRISDEQLYRDNLRKISDIANSKFNFKLDPEFILDFFQEIIDEFKANIKYKQSILIDDSVVERSIKIEGFENSSIFGYLNDRCLVHFSLSSTENKNKFEFKKEDLHLKSNISYHKIVISLGDFASGIRQRLEKDDDQLEIESFKEKIDKVIKRLSFCLKSDVSSFVVSDGFEYDGGTPDDYPTAVALEELKSRKACYVLYLREV